MLRNTDILKTVTSYKKPSKISLGCKESNATLKFAFFGSIFIRDVHDNH